jgi:tRNA(fMet)-specific endonuclease VapC
MRELRVVVTPSTVETGGRYAELYAALRKAGTPIPTNDMWIAAAALSTGAVLLTFDRHFSRIDGLARRVLDPE